MVHTGQHYDYEMSGIFFDGLDLPSPDVNLGVGSGSHGRQTAAMLKGIEDVLLADRPDAALVYGDTNSTLAGALAASKLAVPLVHVEAGLRSFNRRMPEEINRVVADHLSDLLFCPSDTAVNNLAAEGISRNVHQVGDVMLDVLNWARRRASASPDTILERLGLKQGRYVLATVHRSENTDATWRLSSILAAFNSLEEPVVFPIHPRTRRVIAEAGFVLEPHVRLIDPLGYLDMVTLSASARLILTDSGGLQKEAYWLGVPCVTLRDETEWVETVQAGWNTLVGSDDERIVEAARDVRPACPASVSLWRRRRGDPLRRLAQVCRSRRAEPTTVIGVISRTDQRVVIEEFFELFKTPWEHYEEGRAYDVIVMTTGDVRTRTAPGSSCCSDRSRQAADARHAIDPFARRHGRVGEVGAGSLPIYGELLSFGASTAARSVRRCRRCRHPRAAMRIGATFCVRLGYDLFDEVRVLLSNGQPAEHAHMPTLDLHIAMLRTWILAPESSLVEIPPAPAGYAFVVCLTHDIDFVGIRRHRFDHTMWGFLYRSTVGAAGQLRQGPVSIARRAPRCGGPPRRFRLCTWAGRRTSGSRSTGTCRSRTHCPRRTS